MYSEIIRNIVTILMGAGSSQKTSHAAEYCLLDYWSSPQNTLVLISTTTVDKLDMAIYGELKMLWKAARNLYPWLAGHMLESKRAITTDLLEEDEARDIRKGIIGRACYVGKQYVGLGVYAGVKQQRIRFIADELQFMAPTFFDCLPNMFQSAGLDSAGEPDVKVIGSGNPKHDPADQLSIAAEPIGGWEVVKDVTKSSAWDTKFHRGRCLNLIGTDSPNFDVPEGVTPPFPRLISRATVRLVEKRWGKDSLQYNSQCVGRMCMGMIGNRVLTKQFCENHGALDTAIWRDDYITRIAFLDPAWGGDDRCIFGWMEFGTCLQTGLDIIRAGETEEIPIMVNTKIDPDDQIAHWCERRLKALGIPPENLFYGSTGKGKTGASFAKIFGARVPVPLAEGEKPTSRAVRSDLFIFDEHTKQKRLKRCDEEYGRFNAELWFAVRNVVECRQMREMPEDIIFEFSLREYCTSRFGKIELEKKEDTRERMGRSPDKADAYTFGVEGCRQRGFQIGRLGQEIIETQGDDEGFQEEAAAWEAAIKANLLKH